MIKNIMILLILSLALFGCGSKEVAPTEPEMEDVMEDKVMEDKPVEVMEEEVMEDKMEEVLPKSDVTEETMMEQTEKGLAIDVQEDSAKFKEVTCEKVDGKPVITVRITNSGDSTWIFARSAGNPNVRISNRGLPDSTPECDAASIEPGESTVCSGIDVGIIMADKGANRVTIATPVGTDAKIVSCI